MKTSDINPNKNSSQHNTQDDFTSTLTASANCENPPQRYIASKQYILREIAGTSILVSVGSGVADFCGIVTLNHSAKVLWTALQDGATKAELIQKLQYYFALSEEKAAEDVTTSLILLEQRGMISCEP